MIYIMPRFFLCSENGIAANYFLNLSLKTYLRIFISKSQKLVVYPIFLTFHRFFNLFSTSQNYLHFRN